MATNKKPFILRLQPVNLEKIKFIADKSKRSATMQIEFLIENCIADFEKEHGAITVDENQLL